MEFDIVGLGGAIGLGLSTHNLALDILNAGSLCQQIDGLDLQERINLYLLSALGTTAA